MAVTRQIAAVEAEPREQRERWIILATRGLVASGVFFYLCFGYAFFYLRSIDSNGAWQPRGVSAPQGLGVTIALLVVFAAVALQFAHRRDASGLPRRLIGLAAALVLTLATVALQIVEYARLDFGPSSGGYASVFVGWTAMQAVVLLASAVWLEIVLAGAWRARREQPVDKRRMTAVEVRAAATWWTFLAAAGLVAWVLLYLV